jgi:periplasmic protein TonB
MFERLSLPSQTSRWSLGGAAAGSLALHGLALVLALLVIRSAHPATDEPATITVFVPPEPAQAEAPPLPPNFVPLPDEPPTPDFTAADPQLPPPDEVPPPPDFKSPLPRPAPPPPPPRPPPPRPAEAKPHPAPPQQAVATTNPSAPTAAPSAPAPTSSVVAPNWNALLGAWLAAHRAYPEVSRQRGEEGDVTVRFTVAAGGNVVDIAVVHGSGHPALDDAAVGMLRGAVVPPPGAEATRTVHIRFHLND